MFVCEICLCIHVFNVCVCVLQVLVHLVRGYFCLAQVCVSELGQVSARCLQESDPSIQLHGTKV